MKTVLKCLVFIQQLVLMIVTIEIKTLKVNLQSGKNLLKKWNK
jgi:hypothetical protein